MLNDDLHFLLIKRDALQKVLDANPLNAVALKKWKEVSKEIAFYYEYQNEKVNSIINW